MPTDYLRILLTAVSYPPILYGQVGIFNIIKVCYAHVVHNEQLCCAHLLVTFVTWSII